MEDLFKGSCEGKMEKSGENKITECRKGKTKARRNEKQKEEKRGKEIRKCEK